jgi:hypothetical protein
MKSSAAKRTGDGTNRASFGVARLEGGRGSGLDARRPARYYGEGAAAHRHRASRERPLPRPRAAHQASARGRARGHDPRRRGGRRLRDRRDPRGRLDPASRADRARDPRRPGSQADDPVRRGRDRARALPDLELADEGRFPTRRRSAPPSAPSPSTAGLPRAAVVLILLCIGAAAQVERKEAMHQMTELTNTSFDCR